jgi:hypothetical protein
MTCRVLLSKAIGVSIALAAALLGACEGSLEGSPVAGTSVDRIAVVSGVADDARDPSVVYLDLGEGAGCAATVVAPAVLLTARRCVAHTAIDPTCPGSAKVGELRPAAALAVHLGDDGPTAPIAARGSAIVTTGGASLCDADIAFVVLDAPLGGVAPLTLSTVGAAKGHAVRTVGYGTLGEADGGTSVEPARIVRDHLSVLETQSHELEIGEASCDELPGGPALDDANGAIVGVRARSAVSCFADGAAAGADVYTRVDAFASLFAEAMDQARTIDGDAGVFTKADAGHKALDSDVGGACETAADCASGICLTSEDARYCSRTCTTGDKCPTGYACRAAADGDEYCTAT